MVGITVGITVGVRIYICKSYMKISNLHTFVRILLLFSNSTFQFMVHLFTINVVPL